MQLFLLPGLGYDCRIFDKMDWKGYEVVRLNWIEPQRGESLHDYALRLFAQAGNPEPPYTLIGHSLGGIVAQEIASVRPVDRVILISSLKSSQELPSQFRWVRRLRLHKFFTKGGSIRTVRYWGKNQGFPTQADQEMFKDMVGQHSNFYLQWALQSLCRWQSPSLPSTTQLFHIHGKKDKTLPPKRIQDPVTWVENGTHMMVYHQAERIEKFIRQSLG